jgi:hypothetical protein
VISFCGQRTQRHIAANDESPTGRKCDISAQGICLWAGDATDSLVCVGRACVPAARCKHGPEAILHPGVDRDSEGPQG